MHVVYDYQAFSLQTHGGISRYFSEIGPRIAAMPGYRCTVLAGAHRNDYVDGLALARVGFRLPHWRVLSPARGVVNAMFNRAWLARHRPDVVHETYYGRTRLAPAAASIVVTVHDMIHERFPEYFGRGDMTARHKATAVARADAVICVSESTRRDLLALLPVDESKVRVIHHGCTLAPQRPRAESSARPFLLYVGPRGGYKNWSMLIAALGANPSLHAFDLVCFGGRPFTRDETALIGRALPRAQSVLHRQGGDETLASLYADAAALVYPSLYEGFGLPPLEAMASGCPVVCSDASSLPEVVASAAEMFDARDADALGTAIAAVVFSPTRREELRRAGLMRARSLTWARCAERTRIVYEEACVARSSAAPRLRLTAQNARSRLREP